MRIVLTVVIALAALGTAACGQAADPSAPTEGCADVIEVSAFPAAGGTWTFDVTVASADTGWDKYADLWEVVGPDGSVLGARILAHPHVDEQPFTRSQSGIEIPGSVERVTVRAHDSVVGFCGTAVDLDLHR